MDTTDTRQMVRDKNPPPNWLLLAEVDFKLDLEFNDANRREVEITLSLAAERLLSAYALRKDLRYRVITEQGSFWGKTKFYGALAFGFISGIGELKEGVATILESEKVISEQLYKLSHSSLTNDYPIITSGKHAGYATRLNDILNRIQYIQSHLDELNNNQTRQELDKLHQDLANILELLNQTNKQNVTFSLPADIQNSLPPPNITAVILLTEKFTMKPDHLKYKKK